MVPPILANTCARGRWGSVTTVSVALAGFVDTVTRDFENRHMSFSNGGRELPNPKR